MTGHDKEHRSGLAFIPGIGWARSYQGQWLRSDTIAGLTAAAVVIPKAMAYAAIAGLPLQVGLYTAFIPMVIYAFLGTSRSLSVSTTTTIAILVGSALREVMPGADTAGLVAAGTALAVLVGVMLVVAAVLPVGFIANFLSEPVLVGFYAAIAGLLTVAPNPQPPGVSITQTGFLRG